jgi:formylglycine-generating enzyme required for sulfatase activity
MGDAAGTGPRDNDERPVHEVTVRGFFIGRTEVTQAEWEAAMGSNPCSFLSDFLPVNQVTWFDAVRYCTKRSEAEGLRPAYTVNGGEVTCDWSANGYRPPTEAEWEYAARAGQAAVYAGSGVLGDVAWCSDNANGVVHTVGERKPNDLGLYDMSGNVAEWCWGWYADDAGGVDASSVDPRGPDTGAQRVIRGGSFLGSFWTLLASGRSEDYPGSTEYNVGFRLARSRRRPAPVMPRGPRAPVT